MAMQYVNANGALLMAITERQELKVKATKGWRLTNRGRLVVALLALIAVATIINAITPDECKVPVGQMSQFCLDVMYP